MNWIFRTWRCDLTSNTHETDLSLTHFIFDDFSNYSRRRLHFFCFFRFLVCFNRSLHVHSMRLVEIIRTLILLFIMLYIQGVATATELFSATFAVIFLSILWTALKLKIKPKRICSCKGFGLSVVYQWKEVQNITTECLVRTTSCYWLTSTE